MLKVGNIMSVQRLVLECPASLPISAGEKYITSEGVQLQVINRSSENEKRKVLVEFTTIQGDMASSPPVQFLMNFERTLCC